MSLLLLFLNYPGYPTVVTDSPAKAVTEREATLNGSVSSDGGFAVTERGFYISKNSNPGLSDTQIIATGGDSGFTARAEGLDSNTTYYFRAYARNSAGISFGSAVSFTTRKGVYQKTYYYKVYDDNVYKATWSQEVISEPRFKTTINGGPGELKIELGRTFDDFGEDVDVKLNNKVELWVVDEEAPNGRLMYSGFISGYKPIIQERKETILITVIGYVAELAGMILRDASGNTTLAYNSYDPANILKDVIDKYRSLGGSLNYSASSIELTNTVVSYTFNTNTIKECIDKIIELCPSGWFFRIDPDGIIYLQPRSLTATHTFTIGRDIENLETNRLIDNIVNRVLFTGGGSPPLFRKYENTSSQDSYGLREIKKVDQRVTVVATAATISQRIIDDQKDPEIRSKFTIVDSNGHNAELGYDIETIKVGQTLRVKNLKAGTKTISYWDQAFWDVDVWDQTISSAAADVIQILSLEYTPDSIVIEASSRLPQIAKRIEDVNRNLENSQTVDNPVAPS